MINLIVGFNYLDFGSWELLLDEFDDLWLAVQDEHVGTLLDSVHIGRKLGLDGLNGRLLKSCDLQHLRCFPLRAVVVLSWSSVSLLVRHTKGWSGLKAGVENVILFAIYNNM